MENYISGTVLKQFFFLISMSVLDLTKVFNIAGERRIKRLSSFLSGREIEAGEFVWMSFALLIAMKLPGDTWDSRGFANEI